MSIAVPLVASLVPEARRRQITDVVLLSVAATCMVGGVVLCSFMTPAIGVGYLLAGVSSGILAHMIKKLRLTTSLARSATVLRTENDDLKASNDTLRVSIEQFDTQNDELTSNLKTLQAMLNMADDNNTDIGELMKKMELQWAALKHENDRHEHLVTHQQRLQRMQLISFIAHFDSDRNFSLDEDELAAAISVIREYRPGVDLDSILQRIKQNAIGISELADILLKEPV